MRPVDDGLVGTWIVGSTDDEMLRCGEVCKRCGMPVAESCPSYWLASDELWNEVEGGAGGIRCIPCFTRDCAARGIAVAWRAVTFDEMDALASAEKKIDQEDAG